MFESFTKASLSKFQSRVGASDTLCSINDICSVTFCRYFDTYQLISSNKAFPSLPQARYITASSSILTIVNLYPNPITSLYRSVKYSLKSQIEIVQTFFLVFNSFPQMSRSILKLIDKSNPFYQLLINCLTNKFYLNGEYSLKMCHYELSDRNL